MPVVYLVIPCYNEEAVLPETVKRLTEKLKSMREAGLAGDGSRILFVDDGSRDSTWELISRFSRENGAVSGVRLAHNRGHQSALLAGLMTARQYADCAVSMDADLQDDVDVLDEFVRKYLGGCDVVYGVRNKRDTDTAFKRVTAESFYKFMEKLGVETVYNHADYRLMSRRALDALSGYREVNLFLRGLVPLIGFRSDSVFYDRRERFAGESKYPLKKMMALALDGVTSFSTKPLGLIFGLGCAVSLAGLVGVVWSAVAHCAGGAAAWIIGVWSLWLLGGLLMLCLGVTGVYIGKIYGETKARPRFLIAEQAGSFVPSPRPQTEKASGASLS